MAPPRQGAGQPAISEADVAGKDVAPGPPRLTRLSVGSTHSDGYTEQMHKRGVRYAYGTHHRHQGHEQPPDPAACAAAASVGDASERHTQLLSHRAEELLDLRLQDLESNVLAHAPKPIAKRRALLSNLWVLLLAAAILAVVLLGKGRLHVPEPLEHVHAISGAEPYFIHLGPEPITFLYVTQVAAPWHGAAVDYAHQHSRRLQAAAAAAAAAAAGRGQPSSGLLLLEGIDLGGSGSGSGSLERAALPAELRLQLARALAKPRRVLAAAGSADPTASSVAPKLTLQIMQRNVTASQPVAAPSVDQLLTSVIAPSAYSFTPVSEAYSCALKVGQAVKCNTAFTASSMRPEAMRPGAANYLVLSLNTPGQVAVEVHASELGTFGFAKNWVALAILVLMLIAIASEQVHRMWCAFTAAFAMMALLLWCNLTPSLAKVTEFLDESTLGLLFGMMILVGKLKDTGLFEVFCAATLRASRGRMWLLSLAMMAVTAFVSAWLDNVTTILLMGPITLSMMRTCNRDPRPMLMAQVLMSNIGGTATMVGDPPNIIIGTALQRYIGFVDFLTNLAPGVIAACLPCMALILWLYRADLTGPIPDYKAVLGHSSAFHITDWDLMAKSAYVMAAVLVGFLLHPLHHLDPAWIAILGATLLCIITSRKDVEEVMHSVEWDMLMFFAAMFVMVEAAGEVGMIDMIGGWLEAIIRAAPAEHRTLVAIEILLWASAFISALLDNIPYTITMVPVIDFLASSGLGLDITTLAWALAFGACFGGNATLIGASANIVTATVLERQGHAVSFLGWMKVGVPVTVLSVAVANVYMLRYAFP